MTEREKFEANERKAYLVAKAGGKCEVCGAWLNVPQLAHDDGILPSMVAPGASLQVSVRRRTAHSKRAADHCDRLSRPFLDTPYQRGFFLVLHDFPGKAARIFRKK